MFVALGLFTVCCLLLLLCLVCVCLGVAIELRVWLFVLVLEFWLRGCDFGLCL